MSDHINEIRKRHKDAIERFGKYYEPRWNFGLPYLIIGVQSFGLNYDPDDPRHDDKHREWLGIMLAVALKNLVDEHTEALRAENARLREVIATAASRMERGAYLTMRDMNNPKTLREILETKKAPDNDAEGQ